MSADVSATWGARASGAVVVTLFACHFQLPVWKGSVWIILDGQGPDSI